MTDNSRTVAMFLAGVTVAAYFLIKYIVRYYREQGGASPTVDTKGIVETFAQVGQGYTPEVAPPPPPAPSQHFPQPTSASWNAPELGLDQTGWGLMGTPGATSGYGPNAFPVAMPGPVLYTPTSANTGGGGLAETIAAWMADPNRWGRVPRADLIRGAMTHFNCGQDVADRVYRAVAKAKKRA